MSDEILEIDAARACRVLESMRVVDVREPDEFEGPLGHVTGARNVPLERIEEVADELRGGPPVLVICRSGRRSRKACRRLLDHGVPAPTNLMGGMLAWRDAGYPTIGRPLACSEPRAELR